MSIAVLRSLLFTLGLVALAPLAQGAEFQTVAGHFDLPDAFELMDRDESPGEDGSTSGLYVFSRKADPLPRAIFILTFVQPKPAADGDLPGPALAAAMVADPTNASPDPGKSKPVAMGEASAMRHQATLANGLVSIAHVADHGGMRFLGLLKHPKGRDYKRDTEAFEKALAGFTWTTVAAPAADPATADEPAEAPATAAEH